MKRKSFANLIVLCLCAFIFVMAIVSLLSQIQCSQIIVYDEISGVPTVAVHPEEYKIKTLIDVQVKKLPTALIIGVKKSGSGALIEILKLHPQIAAPIYGYERITFTKCS